MTEFIWMLQGIGVVLTISYAILKIRKQLLKRRVYKDG